MAFDPKIHDIDPVTGFHIHKSDGHRVGIDAAPFKRVSDETEWPKWVVPHIGHVRRDPATGHVSTPEFSEHHVARDGEVTVLVLDPQDEERALAAPGAHAA